MDNRCIWLSPGDPDQRDGPDPRLPLAEPRQSLRLPRHDLELGDGDLLVMAPGCQQAWLHAVPVRKKVTTARINLTFRVFRPPAGLTPVTAARSAAPTTRAAR